MKKRSAKYLRSGRRHLGTWLSLGSSIVAELASECNLDWVLIDLEHGCGNESQILAQLQAVSPPTVAIVRVADPNPKEIMRALDWGADGIMVPHVSCAAEAEQCVRAVFYPPRGVRGVSRTVRAYGYGIRTPADFAAIPAPFLAVQIETSEGVSNATSIASVDGVDALFVGPADLAFDLSLRDDAPEYSECLKIVAQASRSAGKTAGTLVRNLSEVTELQTLGYRLLAVNSDLSILRDGFNRVRELAKDI